MKQFMYYKSLFLSMLLLTVTNVYSENAKPILISQQEINEIFDTPLKECVLLDSSTANIGNVIKKIKLISDDTDCCPEFIILYDRVMAGCATAPVTITEKALTCASGLLEKNHNKVSDSELPILLQELDNCYKNSSIVDGISLVNRALCVCPAECRVTSTCGSTDNAITRWHGTTGTKIQNSDLTLSDITGPIGQFTVALEAQGQDISISLIPSGTGALMAAIPDGTVIGGNTRGNIAVDWQRGRDTNSQVASGFASVIAGGFGNTASADASVVSGGAYNNAAAVISSISGGAFNTASGIGSAVVNGVNNIVSGNQSAILGGSSNTIAGDESAILAGSSNNISGNNSAIVAGNSNTVTGTQSTITGGSGNSVSSFFGFIGGGTTNVVNANTGAIVTGASNTISAERAAIVAGIQNTISGASIYESVIGGGSNNFISQTSSFIGAGSDNQVTHGYSGILSGAGNLASGDRSVVVGGLSNISSGTSSFMGAGAENEASANVCGIVAGASNTIPPSGDRAGIVAGGSNTASGSSAFIGAGDVNTASGDFSIIGGGHTNNASNIFSTISGGNTNTASGNTSTIPGGDSNIAAGDWSFAAGRQAEALHQGAFVWADSTGGTFASTAADQFRVRATGGTEFVGDVNITGNLTKGSGAFDIPHPNPNKPTGTRLRHSFVESPTAGDTIYRYVVEVKNGIAEIILPDYFKYLNGNIQAWVQPITGPGITWVECSIEKIVVNATQDGLYSVLVFGTRIDPIAVEPWSKTGVEYRR